MQTNLKTQPYGRISGMIFI